MRELFDRNIYKIAGEICALCRIGAVTMGVVGCSLLRVGDWEYDEIVERDGQRPLTGGDNCRGCKPSPWTGELPICAKKEVDLDECGGNTGTGRETAGVRTDDITHAEAREVNGKTRIDGEKNFGKVCERVLTKGK